MSNGLVSLNDVHKEYHTGSENLKVLNGITLEISEPAKIIITGESGSGKSTLLNLIGGLDQITSGTIKVGDYWVSDLNETDLTEYRSRYIGLIFQFHYLLKDFTALENVMLPGFMAGMPKKKAMELGRGLLDQVGLSSRSTHYPSQMSGGERQRVAVARAMINDPLLILADEPTGNLDEKNSEIVADLLFSLVEKFGKTLLLVTHDVSLSSRGDRRLHLEKGELTTG